jgi:hypothetical protein
VLDLQKPAAGDPSTAAAGASGVALAMNLVGANPQAPVAGLDPLRHQQLLHRQ